MKSLPDEDDRLNADRGYRVSARERKTIETGFADMKRNLGLTRLRLRGLTGANDEFLLAATVPEPQAPRKGHLAVAATDHFTNDRMTAEAEHGQTPRGVPHPSSPNRT
jgi:Transposase DDE domain